MMNNYEIQWITMVLGAQILGVDRRKLLERG
jgi:hypothetical protein